MRTGYTAFSTGMSVAAAAVALVMDGRGLQRREMVADAERPVAKFAATRSN